MDFFQEIQEAVEKSDELFDAFARAIKEMEKQKPEMVLTKIVKDIIRAKAGLLTKAIARAFVRAGDSDNTAAQKATRIVLTLAAALSQH